MPAFDYKIHRSQPVIVIGERIKLGRYQASLGERLECGPAGPVSARAIAREAERFLRASAGVCRPQLAALVYAATGSAPALEWYYPLLKALDEQGRDELYELQRRLIEDPQLDVQLLGAPKGEEARQVERVLRALVAGHLAEIFVRRQDILAALIQQPRSFLIYANQQSYQRDGGVAGGCYEPATQSVKLVIARLFEGFYGATPGVAPLLHELGHMLDHVDAATGGPGRCEGLLPGMSPGDGAIYTPRARELFIAGKRVEIQRYRRRLSGEAGAYAPLPVGHPYVFQNDGEFIAGYIEMFFRNPNYLATQNPELHQAFVELLRQDPCQAWPEDFAYYVEENRAFYLSGQRPWPCGLTLPGE